MFLKPELVRGKAEIMGREHFGHEAERMRQNQDRSERKLRQAGRLTLHSLARI